MKKTVKGKVYDTENMKAVMKKTCGYFGDEAVSQRETYDHVREESGSMEERECVTLRSCKSPSQKAAGDFYLTKKRNRRIKTP